ncbi:PHD finger protein rhinoceros-like [Agrilus planipennis]|uniref:PHD finger protein rhinoceros n=1 Tax=Agrilus planipennis TaxID=224129 RepID=A0A1W4X4C9_AGRPL|nr:PHD finger protein rhinoceros-like [Agrilus planipennis]
MSYRGKRPNRSEDGAVPAKRRKRPTAEEEEAASLAAAAAWQPRPFNDLKGIYNRTVTEVPAELFRKDLISAMKLPDSEPLASDEYWVIVDQWKQEWERGVQVPVNPDSLPEPSVTVTQCASTTKQHHEFRMPKNKYIRITKDENFKVDEHVLSNAPAKAEAACCYDLDECDVAWLKILNNERAAAGLNRITEEQLERVIERLETCCWEKIQSILRNEEGLGIEYDENVICDVCRSPDSEDGNEMVFCDSCNICVHQACYGITSIPEGQWLCGTCATGSRPDCVLCPTKGGAMKATRSGQKWAHVSCALWIPEVSIGCVEKMEPITKISSIPASRWALICVLCRERVGACIQCSVKTCKTAYHVTCAFKHGLEMRAIIEDENADDGVKLRSYCEKHSKTTKKEKCLAATAGTSDDDESKRKKRKDMTSEEKNQARAARLHEIEAEFDKHVTIKDVVMQVDVDVEALQYIYNYWKLKRKAEFNKPLLPPKSDDVDMLSHKQEQADIEKMKMFVQLRQDLERVRNLCYMVSRREKLSRTFFRMREQTFHKQAAVLSAAGSSLSSSIEQAVVEANHGPSIYDRLYSYDGAEDHTKDFDLILARISGRKSPYDSSDEKKRPEFNGVLKSTKDNPYKKLYFNGSSKRRSVSLYGSSSGASSADERPKESKIELARTSSEDEKPSPTPTPKRKARVARKRSENSNKVRSKTLSVTHSLRQDSSSEDDEDNHPPKKEWNRSRLHQMERELGLSGTDSDEIITPVRSSTTKFGESQKAKAISSIYSDSNSSGASSDVSMKDDRLCGATNEALQNKLRTKAAMKEFSQKVAKNSTKDNVPTDGKKKANVGRVKKKELSPSALDRKKDYVPSSMIVPQRQAAKKASENLKATTGNSRVKEQTTSTEQGSKTPTTPVTVEPDRLKSKVKPTKTVVKEIKGAIKRDEKISQSDSEKELEKDDVQDALLAYVPQRQAAKKAAEHIKSGLGTKQLPAITEQLDTDKTKKDTKEQDLTKNRKESENKTKKEQESVKEPIVKPAKILIESKTKSSSSSSSSSSTSSSDSSTSSSSDSDEPSPKIPPPSDNVVSSTSKEQSKRATAKDWPFLDKGPHSAASSSSSSSSESSRSSSPINQSSSSSIVKIPEPKPITRPTSKPSRRPSDKGASSPVEREKPSNTHNANAGGKVPRGRSITSNSRDRTRDVHGRSRNISNNESLEREQRVEIRERKPACDQKEHHEKKEGPRSGNLLSPIRKEDKKLVDEHKDRKSEYDKTESNLLNLEREILERKAGREAAISNKTRSTLDRLLDKKMDKQASIAGDKQKSKLTEKIKSPEKCKSPEKAKSPEKVKSPEKTKSPEKQIKLEREKQSRSVTERRKESLEKQHPTSKKSPIKNKSIDEIFSDKINTDKSKPEPKKSKVPTKSSKSFEEDVPKTKRVDDNQKENIHTRQISNQINENKKSVEEPIHKMVDDKRTSRIPYTNSQNKLMLSPQCLNKDSDLLNFDILDDDGFGISKDEEISRAPLSFSFGNVSLFKEDTKEESARETLNLVEKLRLELSKKSTGCDIEDSISIASSTRQESDRMETDQLISSETQEPQEIIDTIRKGEELLPQPPHVNLEMRVEVSQAPVEAFEQRKCDESTFQYSCAVNVPLESDKNLPKITRGHLDQTCHTHLESAISTQSERWIPQAEAYPPQSNNYIDQSNMSVDVSQRYLEQYSTTETTHHQSLAPQLELRVQEEQHKGQSPIVPDRRVSQTPFLEQSSMDCMPSPSPYGDIHPQAKWADSQIMPARRSSSSSITSTSSSCSRRNDNMEEEIIKRPEIMPMNHPPLDIHFGVLPNMSFPPAPLDPSYPPPFSETSQFVSPVSLFPPPPNMNTQIPFPSPGAAMFPPTFGAPFSAPHSVIPSLSKPLEENMRFSSACTATFTSSQRNMELIAAMVNAPPPNPKESLADEEEEGIPVLTEPPSTDATFPPTTVDESTSPALSSSTPSANHIEPSPNPSVKSNSSAGKRSPSKPTRFSARVTSQQQNKSPTKSPGKSPRQENTKPANSGRGRGDKRSNNKAIRGASRGRGRGRGRGRTIQTQHNDFALGSNNTIHNKLVGTVYDLDFDEDISNENMADLRAMRERRKSADVHDRKSDLSSMSRDSSQSPKFTSPLHSSQKGRSFAADLRDLRPPTPIKDVPQKSSSPVHTNEVTQSFSDIVQPVLPGPVDMRTYNSNFESNTFNETNLLNAFASGTAESQPHEDIDEDFEKEFQSALTASKKPEEPVVPETANIKVSLSDSRNQLKVKIKGPIANYTSVSSLPPSTADPISVSNISSIPTINNVISNAAVAVNSGTSNLRRMRKKELLRQYWTQNMNMDDPTGISGITSAPVAPHINRTTITIPKAVASMTSIPTRDDYRDYRTGADDILDTKIRKENKTRQPLSRELRQLDLSLDDDTIHERRRSVGSTGSSVSLSTSMDSGLSNKRRGRPINKTPQPTPKLKIKISRNSIVGASRLDEKKDRIRPPKKRLATITQPSVEDLKRESMKFRKRVMADFGEERKKKKDKHKKRKEKQEVQIIPNDGNNSTKLIIRFGRKPDGENESKRTCANNDKDKDISSVKNVENLSVNPDLLVNPTLLDESEKESGGVSALRQVRPVKVTPIKLKLSRCQEGSGYVMKTENPPDPEPPDKGSETRKAPSPPADPPPPTLNVIENVHTPTPLILNKDCEVR